MFPIQERCGIYLSYINKIQWAINDGTVFKIKTLYINEILLWFWTHWVMHICISKLTIFHSDYALSPAGTKRLTEINTLSQFNWLLKYIMILLNKQLLNFHPSLSVHQ